MDLYLETGVAPTVISLPWDLLDTAVIKALRDFDTAPGVSIQAQRLWPDPGS